MPTTLSSLLIIVFALIPGLPGRTIYRILLGRDWREDAWDKGLQFVAFSVFGLALYSVVGLGLLALGTVRALTEARPPTHTVLMGRSYELRIYHDDRRLRIRTFYPTFRGLVGSR